MSEERGAVSSMVADPAERERRRWTRENAHLFIRHDAHRFMRPDAARFIRPDSPRVVHSGGEGWRHPDEKLWNFHVQANARRGFPAEQTTAIRGRGFTAGLARLQAQHDSLRRAFVELKHQRQRERALERTEAERLKRRYDAAWDKFIAAFTRHWDTCRKALHPSHFDPSQPRVPAGNPDGGQWTRGGGQGAIWSWHDCSRACRGCKAGYRSLSNGQQLMGLVWRQDRDRHSHDD